MMLLTDWTGLSAHALVWIIVALRLPFAVRLTQRQRILFVVATYYVVMLPVFGLSLAGFLRGMVGDLSIPSVLLLATALLSRLRQSTNGAVNRVWDARDRYALLAFIGVLAFLLYPFALGIGIYDPYRLGFGGVALIVALALVSLWALYRQFLLLPLVIALAVLAWRLGCYESTNLWDYLIDAPVAVYAFAAILKSLLLNTVRGKRA